MNIARAALSALLALSVQTLPALAQDVGQYSIVAIPPKENEAYSQALIIDAKNGYVWEWISQGAMGNRPAFQRLIYQGKVVPGKNSGPKGDLP